ncbi:hypothetical protein [Streptococcus sp. sy018]|uniref:hypothetical protein n=1 Tax=Streptococcus sp. sy018 TaxID=2600147 RepID=UPI0011B621CD|nr:hypothetical protein [Streptococcus sp. sy018]TWS95453.1 hypothetical protein FRX52_01250 [Streptococcus sp. sy018]
MKKYLFLLLSCLTLIFSQKVFADSLYQNYQEMIQAYPKIELGEVKTKIRQKESFYLLIGRPDSDAALKFVPKLKQVTDTKELPIYYLETVGIDSKQYKAFSKKYQIKAPVYLGYFANKKQESRLENIEKVDVSAIENYLANS